MRQFVNFLNKVFFALSAILFVILFSIALRACISNEYQLVWTETGFKFFQKFWSEYAVLLKSFATSATIFIAGYNLTKYIDIAAIESLSGLRNRFNEKGKKSLHLFLMRNEYEMTDVKDRHATDYMFAEQIKGRVYFNTGDTDNDACFKFNSADVLDYLGVIELGYIMYKRKLISLDDFWNQFGYRVEYLLENDAVVEHINHNFQYYDNMVDIIHVLHEKGKITRDLFEKIKPQTEK